MVNALKKLDKKFLILIGCMFILPIVLIIFLALIQGCSNSKLTPDKYEEKMISAAEDYFEEKDKLPKKEGEVVTVKLSTLVKGEYIKSSEDTLDDSTCKGSVTARNNGASIEENNGGFINYTVNLECKDYKTKTLNSLLMQDLTTTGSGLYNQGNIYVFRGDEVNNYITFFGTKYRIVSIDENGIVKLIKSESESIEVYWDIKYNIETESSSGKNIYTDSYIYKYLLEIYNDSKKTDKNSKKHMVASSVCTGARDVNDLSLNNASECLTKLDNQIISLLGVTDYAMASIDPDCISITARSCRNYNYMKDLFLDNWTVTPVASNSYEVYYMYNGLAKYQSANKYSSFNIVINIDGNEIIESGDGSENSPYVIK